MTYTIPPHTGRLNPEVLVRPAGAWCWIGGHPVRFPLSHQILTSVPTEFSPVAADRRVLAQERRQPDDLNHEGDAS